MVRNRLIDVARGIGAVLVVLGHCVSVQENYNTNILFCLIYSFHMPLFMFISGYISYGRITGISEGLIRKRFFALFLPYLIWHTLYPLFQGDMTFLRHPISFYFDSLVHPEAPWFLHILFCSSIVFYLLLEAERRGIKHSFVVFILGLLLFRHIDYLGYHLPGNSLMLKIADNTVLIMIGYLVAKLSEEKNKKKIILLATLALINYLFLFPYVITLQNGSVSVYGLKLIIALSGICLTFLVAQHSMSSKLLSGTLVWLGQRSLEIYLLSWFFVYRFDSVGHMKLALSFCVSMLATTALIRVLESIYLVNGSAGKILTIVFGRSLQPSRHVISQ